MRGTHKIELIARNLKYKITLERNITIITGESATGKSTFRKFIQEYIRLGGKTEFQIKASATFRVFNGTLDTDGHELKRLKDTICILDEDANYINTKEFSRIVTGSSNYFLIIYRGALPNLPYSYKSVYKLFTTKKGDKYITSNTDYFGNVGYMNSADLILTEDSNSGREMLRSCFRTTIEESNNTGNSTLVSRATLAIKQNHKVLLFADGAALGSYITRLRNLLMDYPASAVLWCPESFEFLLLQAGIVMRSDVPKILNDPSSQIESALFLSWERFFTWLVTDIMKDYKGREYSKKHLTDWYLSETNIEKFKKVIPTEILYLLEEK